MGKQLVEWRDDYSLGLAEIDEQHKTLLDLINKVWQAIIDRSEPDTVIALLGELEKYTVAHFAAEETFMRATDYPAFEAHKEAHQTFVQRIADEKMRALEEGTLSIDLLHFLKDWLVGHILVADRAYADFTQRSNNGDSSFLGRFFKRFF
ncbi:bacteriohemerythrin [Propionivibrio limicola]|uniref:bacteriohemerythrin n=1 Tax=Propionivibrio limicola TaxID=167645 RepID=UPI0012928FA1|nr:bacteriohemerythrin [Propionivibrio limicola]